MDAVTQSVAHDTLLRAERRALHAETLSMLERMTGDCLGEMLERLSDHAAAGGLPSVRGALRLASTGTIGTVPPAGRRAARFGPARGGVCRRRGGNGDRPCTASA